MPWIPHPPDFLSVFADFLQGSTPGEVARLGEISPVIDGRYRHWQTVRHLDAPFGWTPEVHWIGLKFARKQIYQDVPLRDTSGDSFRLAPIPVMNEMLHRIDMKVGGILGTEESIAPPKQIVLSAGEQEAIASSQLEGATTTRKVAQEMIRSGREPRSGGERMILDNYSAMQRVREWSGQALTPDLSRQTHPRAAERTRSLNEQGTYRTNEDNIRSDDTKGEELFCPPDADQIPERLERLCAFANQPSDADPFIHPVVRSVILHFWLAYVHPFIDDNGRTARLLFYWSMLRHGYWLAEYVAISVELKKASGRYRDSFLYTETDENDLTYFVLRQLDFFLGAVDRLEQYIDRRSKEIADIRAFLRQEQASGKGLNDRQIALMRHALRNRDELYTIERHRQRHGIVYQTARTDLLGLAKRGLLIQSKQGRKLVFRSAENLDS